MNLNLKDITFIIVTYKSETIVQNCLDTLPKECKKIVIENSNNIKIKNDLEFKYDNIEVILSENNGMGAGNNIGLKACKTEYAYVLNPDTKFEKNEINNLIKEVNKLSDFTLVTPINDNIKLPNFKMKKKINLEERVLDVDSIDGFSMLFNLKKFNNEDFFDENFFLYLENDDLCLRVKNKKESIYVIKKSKINHIGGISIDNAHENLRNWHWMWSKFYYNKKHYGFVIALYRISWNFISSTTKFIFYTLTFNKEKKLNNLMRIKGIFNSILGKKSWYRVKKN